MLASLTTLRSGLSDLRHYINGLEIEYQVLSNTTVCRKKSTCKTNIIKLQNHWDNYYVRKRRFNYNSIIVSLYGYLEQYIENIISKTAVIINETVPSFKLLSQQIQDNHTRLSLELIKKADHSRFRGKFTTADIIANLNYCLNNDSPYHLNHFAFTQHSANFKMDVINENLKFLGIDSACNRVLSKKIFTDYLKKVYPERDVSLVKPEDALFFLQDLAERRNQVAHGVLPDDLLSNGILITYLDFFESFCCGLHQVCHEHILSFIAEHKSISLGKPTDIFRKGSVICIFLSDINIKVNDKIIARSGDGHSFFIGPIEEIRIDNTPHEEIAVSSKTEIGLRLPFHSKKSYEYFLPTIVSPQIFDQTCP